MIKFIVSTTLLGTETGSQPVSFPVKAANQSAAITLARTRLDQIVRSGKASGYTTPSVKVADTQD